MACFIYSTSIQNIYYLEEYLFILVSSPYLGKNSTNATHKQVIIAKITVSCFSSTIQIDAMIILERFYLTRNASIKLLNSCWCSFSFIRLRVWRLKQLFLILVTKVYVWLVSKSPYVRSSSKQHTLCCVNISLLVASLVYFTTFEDEERMQK